VIGGAGGLGLTHALSAVIAGMLCRVKPTDIGIFSGASLSLVTVALLATFLPARRASRIDPMITLRYE
jgi:putative ABC transport system permease protein